MAIGYSFHQFTLSSNWFKNDSGSNASAVARTPQLLACPRAKSSTP